MVNRVVSACRAHGGHARAHAWAAAHAAAAARRPHPGHAAAAGRCGCGSTPTTAARAAAPAAAVAPSIERADVITSSPANNVSEHIFGKLGKGLHRQPGHPLCILKEAIAGHFAERHGPGVFEVRARAAEEGGARCHRRGSDEGPEHAAPRPRPRDGAARR